MNETKRTVEFYKKKWIEMNNQVKKGESKNLSEFDCSQGSNPPPEDGLTIKDLANDPNYIEKIRKIYKKMERENNRSNNIVMYANGYAFTWTALKTLYDFVSRIPASSSEKSERSYKVPKLEHISRKTISVDPEIYEIYQDAISGLGYPASINTLMMRLFSRDILEGKIKIDSVCNTEILLEKLNKQ